MYRQYHVLGLSTYAIAEKIHCDPATIRKNLIKHDIPLRNYVTANEGKRNPFYGRKHSAATKKKMSVNHANVSGENHPQWGKPSPGASERFSGKNNPKWKGGISAVNMLIRGTGKYKQWRRQVYERDLFICQACHKPNSGNLNAHHIYAFASIMAEEKITTVSRAMACLKLWDVENGVTLCTPCHKKKHE